MQVDLNEKALSEGGGELRRAAAVSQLASDLGESFTVLVC